VSANWEDGSPEYAKFEDRFSKEEEKEKVELLAWKRGVLDGDLVGNIFG